MHVHEDRLWLSPSDVTAFLACEHLTALSLAHARGELERPEVANEQAELIFRKGLEHERAYLESLRAEGKTIREIELGEHEWERAVAETEQALRDGVDVVYQGVFADEGWRGIADFLLRQPDGSYEALDTKLARTARPPYILQLLFYNAQLARVQGREPERIHVLLGSGERASFRADEFAAYYRRVRRRLERFVAAPPPTEPLPVDHCRMCDFKPLCDRHWDAVDHLSRVAGVYRSQLERLAAAGITTLAALGRAPRAPAPDGMAVDTWERLREQAELQLWAREHGRDRFVLLQPEPESGLALLPDPSPGDLFFDFEGNPFWDRDGSLEYLWGILDADGEFTPLHAHDHETERQALERFVDLVVNRLERYPDLHVYHYAQYEITALRRLMRRYGTREAELDDLLGRGVFVDLYRVVRNGVRVSRPGYGLKELEAFLDFVRRAEIKDGGTSIVVFEQWMQTRDPALLAQLDGYNREDCVATRLLRDWLLARRAEALERFGPFPVPEPQEPQPVSPEKVVRAELRKALLDAGEELAAQLLGDGERERAQVWWASFGGGGPAPAEEVGGVSPPEDALERLARSLLARDRRYPALESLLRGEPFDRPVQTAALEELKELVLSLDGRHLVVQAPPGSSETWTSARLIAHLLAHGKRIAVASTCERAVHDLLGAVADIIPAPGVASSRAEHDAPLDYLFVVEAGRVSLAHALALGASARNVVLVGDPQQLDEAIQGGGASVLRHLLDGDATIAPDRGVFLERTFRLHPDLCGYVSDEFYEGRLDAAAVAAERTTPVGTGLRYLPVEDDRLEVVRLEVERLVAAGVPPAEIVVLAADDVQVDALREALPAEVPVGGVRELHGREADVVFFLIASSSGVDVPRGPELLLERNRLNVAISRARCVAYLVCSPRLLEVNARSIAQMRLANALCRFVEVADAQAAARDVAAVGS